MNQSKVLTLLPQLSKIRKELKANKKTLEKLRDAVSTAEFIISELTDVSVFKGKPVRVLQPDPKSFEVELAGQNRNSRYTFGEQCGDGSWRVVGYRSSRDEDGKVLVTGTTRLKALSVAKRWIINE